MAGVIVRVLVTVAVAEVLHQLRRRIAQMERDGEVAGAAHQLQGFIDGFVGGVVLLRPCQVDHRLGQRDASLGPSDLRHGIEGGVRQQEGVGIRQSDVLRRTDDDPPGDELRVLAPLYHARHPVESRLGVGAPDRLDERRDDVVVHLAVLVVGKGVLLQPLLHDAVGDGDRAVRRGIDDQLEDVQQLAGVAAAVTQQGIRLVQVDMPFLQFRVLRHRPVEQRQQVVLLQRLKHIELAAGEQRPYHLERRVLRRRPDERHRPLLHGAEQRVLLRLGEAVDLVDEEDRRGGIEEAAVLCPLDDVAHVLHAARHRREGVERRLQPVGDDLRQRRLAHARRSPEDERRDAPRVDHPPEHSPLAHEVLLSDIVVEGARPHPFCQWFHVASCFYSKAKVSNFFHIRADGAAYLKKGRLNQTDIRSQLMSKHDC